MKLLTHAILLIFILMAACQTVPVTGRRQLSLIPHSEILAMSATQYSQFLRQNRLSTNAQAVATVRRVGERIRQGVEKYMAEMNMSDRLEGFSWEFNLVENEQANAWCMPGGKVVVYTGILPICKDENGLAVVMGHEIAHAIAGHGDERLSQNLLATVGQVGLAIALSNKPRETQAAWMAAYGIGTQLGVLLPFSRKHESEADEIGLMFSAYAGYDPREAPKFWERMAATSRTAVPEFLSTHPSTQTRIHQLNNLIPKAMEFYNKSPFRQSP
ncbi:MAG: M48 family metallopeptidase [Cytophagales bacterium]|nr:M48 family metallopeptidase [Bernardetiaceae bacterium]MDW8211236.1 M48 family metallopeptidase [Cytophagales bacterium]